jgi:hypothetical protein
MAAGLAVSGAQAQDVAGTWAVDYDRLIKRGANGQDSVAERGKSRMVIEVKGDSAFGTWITGGAGGQQRILKLRGTRKGNAVKLVSDAQPGMGTVNGKTIPMTFITTYEATVTGDAMVGTMISQPQNTQAMTARARKFEGKREKR